MIAIYGGSFNPPTIAHRNIIAKLTRIFDKVIVVPAGDGYERKELARFKYRYEMLKIMLSGLKTKKIEISKIEDENSDDKKTIKTYDLLSMFRKKYKYEDIYYVCGSDNLIDFKTWYRYVDILKEFKLLVFERANDDIDTIIDNDKILAKYKSAIYKKKQDEDMKMVSSTILRNSIKSIDKEKANINIAKTIVGIDTFNYIRAKRLYL